MYEYDRFEREEGGGSFLMGLLAGHGAGRGSRACCSRPKAGSELRSQLGDQPASSRSTQGIASSRPWTRSARSWTAAGRRTIAPAPG